VIAKMTATACIFFNISNQPIGITHSCFLFTTVPNLQIEFCTEAKKSWEASRRKNKMPFDELSWRSTKKTLEFPEQYFGDHFEIQSIIESGTRICFPDDGIVS
jgi:hypothetical protein